MSVRRSGVTLVEALVGAALALLLLALVAGLARGAQQGAAMACESADALRSAQTAVEAIRSDLVRMFYQVSASDLQVAPDGHGLVLQLAVPIAGSTWDVNAAPVQWSLDPVPGSANTFSLMRYDGKVRRAVNGCQLSDLVVRSLAQDPTTTEPTHLEVIAVGVAGLDNRRVSVATLMLPLPRITRPDSISEAAE